jgi:hypothetical protein
MNFTFTLTLLGVSEGERSYPQVRILMYVQFVFIDFLILGLAGFGQGEYYPYVYYKMNIDMVGSGASLS